MTEECHLNLKANRCGIYTFEDIKTLVNFEEVLIFYGTEDKKLNNFIL